MKIPELLVYKTLFFSRKIFRLRNRSRTAAKCRSKSRWNESTIRMRKFIKNSPKRSSAASWSEPPWSSSDWPARKSPAEKSDSKCEMWKYDFVIFIDFYDFSIFLRFMIFLYLIYVKDEYNRFFIKFYFLSQDRIVFAQKRANHAKHSRNDKNFASVGHIFSIKYLKTSTFPATRGRFRFQFLGDIVDRPPFRFRCSEIKKNETETGHARVQKKNVFTHQVLK